MLSSQWKRCRGEWKLGELTARRGGRESDRRLTRERRKPVDALSTHQDHVVELVGGLHTPVSLTLQTRTTPMSHNPPHVEEGFAVLMLQMMTVMTAAVLFLARSYWGDLEAYLKSYSKRTFQIYSVRTNTPVQKRNERMEANMSCCRPIPEEFKFYNKTYVCTHYGSPRRSTGRGARPHQHSRRIGCEAQINACVREAGGRKVCITKQKTGHNHAVGEEVYQHYHEARTVSDDEVLATVQTLHRAGASRKRILEYITENTNVQPSMKDVHNLVDRLKRESYVFPSVEERIRVILEDFATQPGNLARVYSNSEGTVECISIQSAHMRAMFDKFPEVVFIDATHDTNDNNYKLFSFMIHDAMGKGQHVQHCLLENERKETLRIACQQFKEGCPSYDSIAVIMIDKDFTEIAVLQEEFRSARILLCHFHVVKTLQEQVAKEKYNLDMFTKNEMKRLVQLLVGAPSEEMYDNTISAMKVVLRSDAKRQLWFDYFDENWTRCRERWSSIFRGNIPHMGNQTNNRLKSSWQKLKSLVDRSTSLDDCVVSILFWQTVNEKMWSRSVNRIGVYRNNDYDKEMNRLLNTVSLHAVELVRQQYDFALRSTTEYRYYPLGPYVMMQYTTVNSDDIPDEYMLSTDDWSCSCIFRVTRLLPCRHVIYYRKAKGYNELVPESIIHPRWLVKNYRHMSQVTAVCDDVEEPYEDRSISQRSTMRSKNQNEKFKELFGLGRQIADVGSRWGTSEHSMLRDALQKFVTGVRRGYCPDLSFANDRIPTQCDSGPQPKSDIRTETASQSSYGELPATQSQTVLQKDIEGLIVPLGVDSGTQLSPNGRALQAFIDDLDTANLNPVDQENSTNSSSLQTDQQFNITKSIETVSPPETGKQSDSVQEAEMEQATNAVMEERSASESDATEPIRPKWMISKITRKAGRPKINQAARKTALNQGLKQTLKLVTAIAAGTVPSLKVLLEAVENGASYKYVKPLRALTILQQTKRAKINVFERRNKQPSPIERIMSVLPRLRLDSCDSQVAIFQNRWYSDHEERMRSEDITVMTGGVVYDIKTLKAMRSWHKTISNYDGIESAIRWVENYDESQWEAPEPEWKSGVLDQATTIEFLKMIPVLQDFYWSTTLCGRTMVEGPCMDLVLKTIIEQNSEKATIFTVPNDILRFPEFDRDSITVQVVWEELKNAANNMNLDETRLLFLAGINYNLDHLCAVALDLNKNAFVTYDTLHAQN
ncbi:Hypothetical protein PHPALM_14399, partial [Phytophthora palmivora]